MTMRRTPLVVGALLAWAAAGGCSRPTQEVVTVDGTATQMRLSTVSELYTAFTDRKGRPPAHFEEMRAFGAALSPSQGGPINVTEEFLVSPRDNSPLVVRYKAPLRPKSGDSTGPVADGPVVSHEHTGVGGRRFVVFGGSNRIEQVDEARFKELVP